MRALLRNFLMMYVACLALSLLSAVVFEIDFSNNKNIIKHAVIFFLLYLSGSIPFGLLFAKALTKQDVRSIGSGNIGMTNVLRTGSKMAAALTLLFDVLKGFLPLFFLREGAAHLFPAPLFYIAFLIPVLGHMFPCWLNFKGGKGIATGLGAVLAFSPPLALICFCLWVSSAKLFKISSLAGLIAFGSAPFLGLFFKPWTDLIWLVLLTALVFLAHRDNIKRLFTGQENKFGTTSS